MPPMAFPDPWPSLSALTWSKTKLAEAIRYALSRWAGLCLFLRADPGSLDSC
jgi:hypothetical protein